MFTVYGLAEASVAVSFPKVEEEFTAVYVHRDHLNLGSVSSKSKNMLNMWHHLLPLAKQLIIAMLEFAMRK